MPKTAQRRSYKADEKKVVGAKFLFPLRLPIARSEANPLVARLCKSIGSLVRCPNPTVENGTVIGSFGGPAPKGGVSTVDDWVAKLPANLQVSFVLQQMENEVVAGNGVDIECWATWQIHSPAATHKQDGGVPYSLPAPGPGEIWPVPFGNGIYNALVHDGCGSTPVFPVELYSSVGELPDIQNPPIVIGEFSAVDDTTLQPNGFWTFSYAIRATGTNGGVSDFKFNGVVSITCTNIDQF